MPLKQTLFILIKFFILLLISGCSWFPLYQNNAYKDYSVHPLNIDKDNPYNKMVNHLTKKDNPIIDENCFNIPIHESNISTCSKQRNDAIAALIYNSEQLCVDHRRTMYGNEASFNIVSGSFANIFSGAATIASVESTKTIFSALSLFSNSERSLINETYYKTVLIEAIDTKIVETREEMYLKIYNKFKTPINNYTMTSALYDVIQLHYSCSFMNGLRLVLKEGTDEREKQKILRLKKSLLELDNALNAIAIDERNTTKSIQYNGLKARYKAITDKLIELEKL
jgi:ribosomal protein S24E